MMAHLSMMVVTMEVHLMEVNLSATWRSRFSGPWQVQTGKGHAWFWTVSGGNQVPYQMAPTFDGDIGAGPFCETLQKKVASVMRDH